MRTLFHRVLLLTLTLGVGAPLRATPPESGISERRASVQDCRVTASRLQAAWRRQAEKGLTDFPITIETPKRIEDLFREATRLTDAQVAERKLPTATQNPARYRAHLQQEFGRLRAEERIQNLINEWVKRGELDPNDRVAMDRARRRITKSVVERLPRESVLFVDTAVLDAQGKPINRDGLVFVIDHHGPYAPSNPLENSGAQVISRLQRAAQENLRDGKVDVESALKQFHKDLYGDKSGRILLSADNLADAAEVLAILRNPELQRRIIADPKLAEMLTTSGRFTDFFVFSGDGYETANPDAAKSVALSKAIMQSHSEVLKQFNIAGSDRITSEALSHADQKKLLELSAQQAEKLLLEATDPARGTKPGTVDEKAAAFDAARGGPNQKVGGTSYDKAREAHVQFTTDLSNVMKKKAGSETRAAELESAFHSIIYGHGQVITGHLFADWAASPMANAHNPTGRRPVKLELAGSGNEVGKIVVLAKSGNVPVNLTRLAQALNDANDAKKAQIRAQMEKEGKPEGEIAARLGKITSFVPRGKELVFNFGGHALGREEVQFILAEATAGHTAEIVPDSTP